MSFFALMFKNLLRQRIRTGLTVLGISLGITTIVALGVVTSGFKQSAAQIIRVGGADFMVAQRGAADFTFSIVSEKDVTALDAYPGVERAEGVLVHVARVGANPFFLLMGRQAAGLAAAPPPLVEGSYWGPSAADEVLLGQRAAEDLGVRPGDQVAIEDRSFRVVGVYRTGKFLEDSGAYAPLRAVQRIASKSEVVSTVFVTARPGVDVATLADGIEKDFENLAVIVDAGDFGKVDQGLRMMDAANLAISVLAVGIGGIGVMNTMAMSVLERTREFGILRAVGWRGSRILRMVVGESVVLCVAASFVGAALGVIATRAILVVDMVRNIMQPHYTADIFVRALMVAVAVALLGAAYPAFRAVRLTPMEALRYE
jgi:putative ABC transport system permease protein